MLVLDLLWVRYLALILWGCFSFVLLPAPLHASEEVSSRTFPIQYGGYLKNETAFRFGGAETFTKILNILELEVRYPFLPNLRFTGIGRFFFDAIYSFYGEETIRGRENTTGDRFDLRDQGLILKEAYFDISTRSLDFRLGKQIVRWGILEGFRVTDEINPLDFKEFVLRGIEDRYIPLWLMKGEYFGEGWSAEVVWIPDIQFHKPAPAGSEWEEFQLPVGISEPSLTLLNTEAGIRITGDFLGGDAALSYFYTWDDFPAAFRNAFGLGGGLEEVDVSARYTRLHIFGGSYSKSLGSLVLGVESAFVPGKFFGTRPVSFRDDELKRDLIKYGFLLDFSVGEIDLSVQFSQEIIPNYDSTILQKQFESAFSLFMQREFFYNRLGVELFLLYFVTYSEFVIRPRVDFKMTDQTLISMGLDLFEGPQSGNGPEEFRFVGFFRNHDRVFLEMKYAF